MLNLLTESDVAKRLQVSLASVRRWQLEKRGPVFVKVGALVRYRPEDLENSLATTVAKKALRKANPPQLTDPFDRIIKDAFQLFSDR